MRGGGSIGSGPLSQSTRTRAPVPALVHHLALRVHHAIASAAVDRGASTCPRRPILAGAAVGTRRRFLALLPVLASDTAGSVHAGSARPRE